MNENAKRWVEALRSGKYKQVRRSLAKRVDGETRYCCLGVACELAADEGVVVRQTGATPEKIRYAELGGHGSDLTLPQAVREWLGLQTEEGTFRDANLASSINSSTESDVAALTSLNDGACYTFDQIADVIEREPKGLFT